MLTHPLTDFEIQKYYQNKPKCIDVYWSTNLHKTKDAAFVINLDEYKFNSLDWSLSE